MSNAEEVGAIFRAAVYALWQDGLVSDDDMMRFCFEDDDCDDDGEDYD